MKELATWLKIRDPEVFPSDAVVREFRRVGKHFVARDVLALLDEARSTLAQTAGDGTGPLARFLDCALDKWDGRYDNPSYLGLVLLPLPGTGERAADPGDAARRRDRLLTLLVTDTLRFELAAADGRTSEFPQLRPGARILSKRCRLGLRAIGPALGRLGLDGDSPAGDPVGAARRVCRMVAEDLTEAEVRMLRLTVLPVSLVHDEYMFIRMLQSYETTFSLIAVQLGAAIGALADGRPAAAVRELAAAERAMREAAPLWSFVATLQPEAFLTFRQFTDGASAIQSRSYKLVESLCRRPDQSRLDSPAYRSVPEIRERVLAGAPNLEDTLAAARASGALTVAMHDRVRAAMERFEAAVTHWRQTHYRLAVRMLGDRRGTGSTEGVPYLEQARAVPVFASTGSHAGAVEARPPLATTRPRHPHRAAGVSELIPIGRARATVASNA